MQMKAAEEKRKQEEESSAPEPCALTGEWQDRRCGHNFFFFFFFQLMSLVGVQNNTPREKTTSNIIHQKPCAGGISFKNFINLHVLL